MPPGSRGRICGGYVGRRSRVLPRENCPSVPLSGTSCVKRRSEGRAGVSRGHSSRSHSGEGPNTRSRPCTKRSMPEEDADTTAEMPEWSPSAGGGTAEGRETERQTGTARDEHASEGARAPEPHVFPVNRRIRNRTSGGVGGWGREAPPYPLPDRRRVRPLLCRHRHLGIHREIERWASYAVQRRVGISITRA